MKYKIIQDRETAAGDRRYVDVAVCDCAEDALLIAEMLFQQRPMRGCVQVWGFEQEWQSAYNLFVTRDDGTLAQYDLMAALAGWKGREKKWRAHRLAQKQAAA